MDGTENYEENPRARANQLRANTRVVEENEDSEETEAPVKKAAPRGGYILFFFILGFAIGKDIIDLFSFILNLVGLGLAATAIGAPVGVVIGVFGELIAKGVGLIVDFIILTYFAFTGGKFMLRFVITSIGAIIDAIPGLDILPMTTIMFVVAFLLGRVSEKVLSKVAQSPLTQKLVSSVEQKFSKA